MKNTTFSLKVFMVRKVHFALNVQKDITKEEQWHRVGQKYDRIDS